MPRKVFAPGDVLAAADVNTYLMNQAVMTFADSAARTAALPTPSEGMVTYLNDTNKLSVYDGANWVESDPIEESLLTTTGDIIYASGAGTAARLAIGTATQVLTVTGGIPAWADASGGGGGGGGQTLTFTTSATLSNTAGWYLVGGNVILNGVSLTTTPTLQDLPASATVTLNNYHLWTSRTSGFGATTINALTFGNGVYVAGGEAGTLTTSTDAITWTTRTSNFGASAIYALTFGNNVYVAGGLNGALTTSTDGTTWTTRTSGFGSTEIRALSYGAGVYLAVGDGRTAKVSTDGVTWTDTTNVIFSTVQNALAATFGTIFVVGGTGSVLSTSTDGLTWTTRTSGASGDITALTYGGLYVLGVDGRIRTSTNGITWTSRTSGISGTILGLGYSSLGYVAVSSSGGIAVSTDAITWTQRANNLTSGINAVATNGSAVAVAAGGAGLMDTSSQNGFALLSSFGTATVVN
jgi:hypothetical protein